MELSLDTTHTQPVVSVCLSPHHILYWDCLFKVTSFHCYHEMYFNISLSLSANHSPCLRTHLARLSALTHCDSVKGFWAKTLQRNADLSRALLTAPFLVTVMSSLILGWDWLVLERMGALITCSELLLLCDPGRGTVLLSCVDFWLIWGFLASGSPDSQQCELEVDKGQSKLI